MGVREKGDERSTRERGRRRRRGEVRSTRTEASRLLNRAMRRGLLGHVRVDEGVCGDDTSARVCSPLPACVYLLTFDLRLHCRRPLVRVLFQGVRDCSSVCVRSCVCVSSPRHPAANPVGYHDERLLRRCYCPRRHHRPIHTPSG